MEMGWEGGSPRGLSTTGFQRPPSHQAKRSLRWCAWEMPLVAVCPDPQAGAGSGSLTVKVVFPWEIQGALAPGLPVKKPG